MAARKSGKERFPPPQLRSASGAHSPPLSAASGGVGTPQAPGEREAGRWEQSCSPSPGPRFLAAKNVGEAEGGNGVPGGLASSPEAFPVSAPPPSAALTGRASGDPFVSRAATRDALRYPGALLTGSSCVCVCVPEGLPGLLNHPLRQEGRITASSGDDMVVLLSSMPAEHLMGKAVLREHRFGVSSGLPQFPQSSCLSLADPLFFYLFFPPS